MIALFWVCLFIIFYAFVGYGIFLFVLLLLKRLVYKPESTLYSFTELPSVTLIIAAYNEGSIIRKKIENTLLLSYPLNKLNYIVVTDGSTDNSAVIVAEYPQIILLHREGRTGKINAVHRAMQQVNSEIVIFTDANTFLNQDALINISRHYKNQLVGAVAGEKRVWIDEKSDATAGEGIYWKYESKLKKWDSDLNSVVGAAGELFSIRTSLYEPVEKDTLLDDFIISMRIAAKGFKIVYEPEAFAMETSSENIKEELKRKVRIAAGGIQSILRLKELLNVFRYPILSFQYISHRVLRWTVIPFLIIFVFALNILIIIRGSSVLYLIFFSVQIIFYMAAALGWLLEKRQLRNKFLFIPYYFVLMNYAVLAGIKRFYTGAQQVTWDKAKRKASN